MTRSVPWWMTWWGAALLMLVGGIVGGVSGVAVLYLIAKGMGA